VPDAPGLDGTVIREDGTVVALGGRVLAGPPSGMGVIENGRPASAANVRAAARYWPQGDARDFALVGEYCVDLATDRLYRPIIGDPLVATRPDEVDVSVFFALAGRLVFLQPAEVETLADLRARDAAVEDARLADEKAIRDFRASQKQVTLSRAELPPNAESTMTLREAAERILGIGGRIERGRLGLRITVPARLTPDTGFGSGPMELGERQTAALAAQTLTFSEALVLEATTSGRRSRCRSVSRPSCQRSQRRRRCTSRTSGRRR
jgi:hypothetical protein